MSIFWLLLLADILYESIHKTCQFCQFSLPALFLFEDFVVWHASSFFSFYIDLAMKCFLYVFFTSLFMQIQDEGRTKVRKDLTPLTMQLALQRILPFPCKKQYTVVILMPQISHLSFLKSLILLSSDGFTRNVKVGHVPTLQNIFLSVWSSFHYNRSKQTLQHSWVQGCIYSHPASLFNFLETS